MNWYLSYQADPRARRLADRHYSRQTIGAAQFCPPGRKIVLLNQDATALWVTSYPFAEYVNRDYKDAWICTLFRNESGILSSQLILEAVAATRWKYGTPPASGMITLVDARKVNSCNPGFCYKEAGFKRVGYTQKGLHILQLLSEAMPEPAMPYGATYSLLEAAS